MPSFATAAIRFFCTIQPPPRLPSGVEALFPYQDLAVQQLVKIFFRKFFADREKRIVLVGINPGRFGAGITGINFTAPRQLSEDCGIPHHLGNGSELSAEFIYSVIQAFGGPATFYRHFYLAALSPVGYVKAGKNLNYYDDPQLQQRVTPFILQCLKAQLDFGVHRQVAICIGGDKNFRFLNNLNEDHGFFREILTVPHPRFIMQYRRSSLEQYLQEYLDAMQYCLQKI